MQAECYKHGGEKGERDQQGPGQGFVGRAGFVGGAWIWILNQFAKTTVINLNI